MKVYITNQDIEPIEGYTILTTEEGIPYLLDFIDNNKDIGFDIETNGLDAWINKPILYSFSTLEEDFVLHHPSVSFNERFKIFDYIQKRNTRLIGQNIKFDLTFVLTNENTAISNVYDTMIAEQRIWQKLGISVGLGGLTKRYLGDEASLEVDKDIRLEFIGADVHRFKVTKRHLDYVTGDSNLPIKIKEKQDKYIMKKNLYNLLYKIEFPLISIVAKAEVEGFDFDMDKWRKIYESNIEKMFLVECKLDKEFRRLRDAMIEDGELTEIEKLRCIGGVYDKDRIISPLYNQFNYDGSPKSTDLFGNPSTKKAVTGNKSKIDFYPYNINYGSDTKIVEIFAHLKEEVPTASGNYVIPKFKSNGKLYREYERFTTGGESLHKLLVDYPETKMRVFIELLLEYRSLNTRINNFGVKYESKINPVTGKIHTAYRQCRAVTGRFQSGGGRNEPMKPNFQNIPADAEMRSCFIAPKDHSIITADYTGAELIVLCSHSQDMDLLEMSKRDMHSEIATACWRAVYMNRLSLFKRMRDTRSYSMISMQEVEITIKKYEHLVSNFKIDKSPEKVHLRTAFKPVTFGVIYGLRHKHLAKSLNIDEDEAKIIINTIRGMFPKAFSFVEECSRFAENNGYLVLNNRTNSRVYFPYIIQEMKGEISRDTMLVQILKDINEARNIPIQGTQADAVKEASVALDNFFKKRGIRAMILIWVHDEFVIKVHDDDLNTAYTIKGVEYPTLAEAVSFIMCDTFNKYLTNVKIGVDYDVAKYWVKG